MKVKVIVDKFSSKKDLIVDELVKIVKNKLEL